MNEQEKYWEENIPYMDRNGWRPHTYYAKRRDFFEMLGTYEKGASILEVGCSLANNIGVLSMLGYEDLHGIDICPEAVYRARKNNPIVPAHKFKVASALELPYEDNTFDLVFTSGVLIHQEPDKFLNRAMSEIYRVSRGGIAGMEDFSKEFTGKTYTGKRNFYWSGPFLDRWRQLYPTLEVLENSPMLQDIDNSGIRRKYLLRKTIGC